MIRAFSSAFEDTRIPLRMVLVILAKKTSTKFSQDPCFGVNTNSKRLGRVLRYVNRQKY